MGRLILFEFALLPRWPGGVFFIRFRMGFSIKGANWLCYLGGVWCAFAHFHARILRKSRQIEDEQKGQCHFRARILCKSRQLKMNKKDKVAGR